MSPDDERRKLAIQKLKVRAEMRSAPDEEEDSVVIQQRAEARIAASKSPSVPPQGPFGWLVHPVISVIKLVPPPHRVFIAGLLVLVIFAGVGKAYRWW